MTGTTIGLIDKADEQILAQAAPREAALGDYMLLLKPRVMSLVIFTAFAGLIM